MTDHKKTLEMALESAKVLEQQPCCHGGIAHDCHAGPGCRIALRLKAASQAREMQLHPAQQDDETIVQTFTGLPKQKLRELLAAGWQINGVCFQRTEEDGTARRGAATTGGMVLWWNQEQPAQQQEPVAWGIDWGHNGERSCASIIKKHHDGTIEVVATEYDTKASPPASKSCEWQQEANEHMPDTWHGNCGAVWTFTDGSPLENDMRYCPKCGGRLHQKGGAQ